MLQISVRINGSTSEALRIRDKNSSVPSRHHGKDYKPFQPLCPCTRPFSDVAGITQHLIREEELNQTASFRQEAGDEETKHDEEVASPYKTLHEQVQSLNGKLTWSCNNNNNITEWKYHDPLRCGFQTTITEPTCLLKALCEKQAAGCLRFRV